jgi:hypothetical protein
MFYNNASTAASSSFEIPTANSTGTCPAEWRAWWLAEAERSGSDWRSLITIHLEVCDRLRASSSRWSL